MDDETRRKVVREELVGLLINTVEQAHDLATARLPTTANAVARHYQRLENAGRDAASLATALRILDQGEDVMRPRRRNR